MNKLARIQWTLTCCTCIALLSGNADAQDQLGEYPSPGTGCLACHTSIEPIRAHDSGMMQDIYAEGKKRGDLNGCTVCHRGNPNEEEDTNLAHADYIRYPASMWVNEKTCGLCHAEYIYAMNRNLMQTEAGKIQGALWGWGQQAGYQSVYGNYAIDDPDGKTPSVGSEAYKQYIKVLHAQHAYAFPDKLELLPEVDLTTLPENPQQAVLTYIRGECQRCHLGVKGKQRRGDYRGMGCSACHIPYSVEGLYEGSDPTIDREQPGHPLVHMIQSTREAAVQVGDVRYTGIPSEQCTSCHNRGKRVGVSFLGIMESPYGTPWNDDGSPQQKLHGKNYAFISADAHHSVESRPGNPAGRILCQDCHTTIDVHGDGNIHGTIYAAVEIECSDCHGTPNRYPWELPLGHGDEFGLQQKTEPRGVSNSLLDRQRKFGLVHAPEEGYLLSARGNPLGNVVKRGNAAILHSAGGSEFSIPVLKNLAQAQAWKHPLKAQTAMVQVRRHLEANECYACHSAWAAQCYGCHVKVDYSQQCTSVDWIKSGNTHYDNGETAETLPGRDPEMQPGQSTESRSYTRWEDPILGINGEGRVSPIIPGCQQITTVIGPKGKPLVLNKVWRTPAGLENSDASGQRGIDITPAQPHTVTAQARDCVSCHTNPKALGYGIQNSQYMRGYEKGIDTDITTAKGDSISVHSTPQMNAIPDLPMDLSQVVTREGKQVQTVGHHWELSGPLTQHQREKMERVGVCIACHQTIPDGTLFVKAITSAGEVLNMVPHTDMEHTHLLHSDIKWAAFTRIMAPLIGAAMLGLVALVLVYRRKYLQAKPQLK